MALRTGQVSLAALASATSANGTARNGTTLPLAGVKPGSLAIDIDCSITTASVLATFKVQASSDASTWRDVYAPAAISVASSAGTGSAVTTNRTIVVPGDALSSYAYARVVATLSGAATAGADVSSATYRFCRYGMKD
jgi:hypothetical protein